MKTLILVRHAKSSWENPSLSDHERPLNSRGLRDAPFMGKLLNEKGIKPDLIISSPAVRAATTAQYFANALDYPVKSIMYMEMIYGAGPKEILDMLNQMDDNLNCILLFGHNPDITALSNYLSDEAHGNLPTTGTICIDFDVDSWSNVGDESGTIRFFEYPKKYFKKG
jgi:phosphohistidine phosphatase